MDSSPNSSEEKFSFRYGRLLWTILFIVEILLGFRFVLKFIGSYEDTGLTGLIYKITQPFASPFLKALGVYGGEGSVFEWTTLIAMAIYWIITWIIIKIFMTDNTVSAPESERNIR